MPPDTVLDAVRAALAGVVVAPLPRVPAADVARDRDRLAARFVRAARDVGTIVHEVDTPTAAIATVAGILGALSAAPRVVSWPTPLARDVAIAACASSGAVLRIVGGGGASEDLAVEGAATEDVAAADVGITEADYLVAESGTLVLRAADRPRGVSLLPPVHVAIVGRERLRADLGTAFADLRRDGAEDSCVTLVTGPSRTADIEKKLVVGVHGPCALHVVLLARTET